MTENNSGPTIIMVPSDVAAKAAHDAAEAAYARGLADGRKEAKSPMSFQDLLDHPQKRTEYLKLHDAEVVLDDGRRTSDGVTFRVESDPDRLLGYSLVWKHGCMHIGYKSFKEAAELWGCLFIYFWKYHGVGCQVLDDMLRPFVSQVEPARLQAAAAEAAKEAKTQ